MGDSAFLSFSRRMKHFKLGEVLTIAGSDLGMLVLALQT